MINLYSEDFQEAYKLIVAHKATLELHVESPHNWLKKAAREEIGQVNKVLTRLKDAYNKSIANLEITGNGS